MKYFVFLVLCVLTSAAHANPESAVFSKEGMALFYEGKAHYEAGRYRQARDAFAGSTQAWIDGANVETKPESYAIFVSNAKLLKRWQILMTCQEFMHSNDIEKVRDSIGLNQKAPDPLGHESCLRFPDHPQLVKYVQERIDFLSGKTGRGPPQPPEIKLEADPAVFAETKNCRSDQNNRDARSCFYEAMDRGGGSYNFRMNKDCPAQMNYLAVVFAKDAAGVCTRQVKIWTPQTPGKEVLVASPGGAPEIKDAVIVRADDDITACYIKRHNGRPCEAK